MTLLILLRITSYNVCYTKLLRVLLIFLVCFLLIVGKVFHIQVIDYEKLNSYASNLWSRNLPIEADRGVIYDRDGIVLASNITTSSVIVIRITSYNVCYTKLLRL